MVTPRHKVIVATNHMRSRPRGHPVSRSVQDRKNVPGTCVRPRCFSADMPASLINDPEHWRDRAREKRALADRLTNEQVKQTVLRVANEYERLTEQAEERSRGSPQSK